MQRHAWRRQRPAPSIRYLVSRRLVRTLPFAAHEAQTRVSTPCPEPPARMTGVDSGHVIQTLKGEARGTDPPRALSDLRRRVGGATIGKHQPLAVDVLGCVSKW